jgi:hypothetical protein
LDSLSLRGALRFAAFASAQLSFGKFPIAKIAIEQRLKNPTAAAAARSNTGCRLIKDFVHALRAVANGLLNSLALHFIAKANHFFVAITLGSRARIARIRSSLRRLG